MRLGVLIAMVVPALVSLPVYESWFGLQSWNRMMHLVGTVMFVGNIAVSAAWVWLAKRTGDHAVLRFAASGVVRTDVAFTLPGVNLLVINGWVLARSMQNSDWSWLIVAVALFVLSGVVWGLVLVPSQRELIRVCEDCENPDDVLRRWFRWGGIASVFVLASLWLMIEQPTLWTR